MNAQIHKHTYKQPITKTEKNKQINKKLTITNKLGSIPPPLPIPSPFSVGDLNWFLFSFLKPLLIDN